MISLLVEFLCKQNYFGYYSDCENLQQRAREKAAGYIQIYHLVQNYSCLICRIYLIPEPNYPVHPKIPEKVDINANISRFGQNFIWF